MYMYCTVLYMYCTVLHCTVLLCTVAKRLNPSTSFLHCEQGVPASMTATLMALTVSVEKAMGGGTVKLLLEKVRFARVGSPCVHVYSMHACLHMFKPVHCQSYCLGYSLILQIVSVVIVATA